MDNEEIKKLLQELKETSSESSAVRSKVVKIHMDTPAEAERRQKEKARAKALEARRQAEEQARAEALEAERRLEAEKAALEAVEEAKAEAKAGFAADLDDAISSMNTSLPEEEQEEAAVDLDLNWHYEKPALTSSFARDEDFGPSAGGSAGRKGKKKGAGAVSGEEADPGEDDFDSDEADFRSDDEEEGSITGLPGRFGALSDRMLSFFGGIRNSVKEDLAKVRGKHAEEDEDAEDQAEEAKEADDAVDAQGASDAEDADSMESVDSIFRANQTSGVDLSDKADSPDSAQDAEAADDAGSKDQEPAPREYGPDEEWKRRMEEAPKKKSRFQRMMAATGSLGGHRRKEKKPKEKKIKEKKGKEKQAEEKELLRSPEAASEEKNDIYDENPEGVDIFAEAEPEEVSAAAEAELEKETAFPEPNVEEKTAFPESDAEQKAVFPSEDAEEKPARQTAGEEPEEKPETEDAAVRSIEIIDLNENQNNKEAEVIPLVGDTGPLPDPAELKRAGGKKRSFRFPLGKTRRPKGKESSERQKENDASFRESSELLKENDAPVRESGDVQKNAARPKKSGARGKNAGAFREFLSAHRKQLVIGLVAAAVLIALAVLIISLAGRMKDKRHAEIKADEGLTVRVLKQPDSFTKEGDVQISVKAPETIQSITVNGENVVSAQDRSVEFNYHATGGTLDLMAVSTDKVRSAKVVLAYVDSQPPVVTIKEQDGRIALSAEDSESGLDAIYIGRTNGTSEIPLYEKYSETLEMDPEKVISYYAEDTAGNRTTPVTVALTPAESIAFEQERYGLFPGETAQVKLVTTPANAFVNNLALEAENPKIVQMEGDMMIRGMAEGDTKITATADGIAGVMASVSVSGQRKVKISAIGDCTLGSDSDFSQNTSFDAYEAMYGDSYFFEKVKGILSSDDATFANFEGTLTTAEEHRDTPFTFKGDPSYTQILKDGSVEVVTLANNHAHDYLEQGLADTKSALDNAGIDWCENERVAYQDLNGVRTAFIGIYALENGLDSMPVLKAAIAEAKQHGADLIIVGFHWGVELVTEIDEFERELAHTAIDEGANLVIGTHSHVLMGIEKYNGSYILYGIGNFCFGGNANPTSYDSMIWQQTFTFTADGLESEDDIAIIPCQVSGDTSMNNYQPVPVSGDAAARIMQTIDSLSAEFGQSYSGYMVDGTLWTDDAG